MRWVAFHGRMGDRSSVKNIEDKIPTVDQMLNQMIFKSSFKSIDV
jgi:hypothetical protein